MQKIQVMYQANYNGCVVIENEDDFEHERSEEFTDAVCNYAIEKCNDVGKFYGDEDELEEFIVAKAKEMFGDVEVEVEFDHCSS